MILNNNDAIAVLESVGCHNFKPYDKEIRCALPDRHNSSAVVINRTTMSGRIYLPNEEVVRGDLYTLVMQIKECSFIDALKHCNSTLGYETSYYYKKEDAQESPLALQRKIKRKKMSANYNACVIDDDYLNRYLRYPHINFLQDNISAKTQNKYDICFDEADSRIVIPHRKWDTGEIIGLFGRTTNPNYKELDIPKYFGIRPYPKMTNLYGLYQNYKAIQEQGYVVVLEAEKSVMQLDSIGIEAGVAVCCHEISPQQRKILIGMDVEIVIAFDKGISLQYIKDTASKFKKYRKCTYIFDDLDLLNHADSPTNKGRQVWKMLFENRK